MAEAGGGGAPASLQTHPSHALPKKVGADAPSGSQEGRPPPAPLSSTRHRQSRVPQVRLDGSGWRSLLAAPGLEPVERVLPVGGDGLVPLLPVGGAALALVRGCELGRLEEPQGLVDGPPNGLVVHRHRTDNACGVDDKGCAHRHPLVLVVLVLDEHAKVARDLFVEVGEEGVLDVAHAPVLARRAGPGQVRVLRVDAHPDHLGAQGLEVLETVVKLDNLGGADKGEVQGIEEEHHPLLVLDQRLGAQVLKLPVEHRGAAPGRGGLANREMVG
mmetsp:Transcript_6718/g.17173  ORF Transcript_6718/g.17173 Transcript_6718/m.17173 type:complete len:273 (-) Transcript_6718:889-1707(-)